MVEHGLEDLQRRVSAIAYNSHLAADLTGGVLVIAFDAPQRLNAFDVTMHQALASLLGVVEDERSIRSVVLMGRGRAFSAGQDLQSVGTGDGAMCLPSDMLRNWYNPLILKMRTIDVPIVAAINGVVAGGAVGIAMACDVVVAATTARFILGFSRIALVPDCGATWLLPRVIGDARARALLLLDQPIDSETAERIGLLHRRVDDDALLPTATELARKLAARPRSWVGKIKRALHEASNNDLAAQLEHECRLQREAEKDASFAEGLLAFRERREPNFY